MELLKTILGKIGGGILFGVGFFISFAILGSIAMPLYINKVKTESEKTMADMFIEYDENAKLEAEITSETIGDGEFTILGKLFNRGEKTWSSVTLKAELYDESGAFIDECREFIQQTSLPGSEINFKMSCGSKCSKLPLENYSNYKLIITDARYRR